MFLVIDPGGVRVDKRKVDDQKQGRGGDITIGTNGAVIGTPCLA